VGNRHLLPLCLLLFHLPIYHSLVSSRLVSSRLSLLPLESISSTKSLKKKGLTFFFLRSLSGLLNANPLPPRIPCMDAGSAATAAGIDPKILDNWQTDGAFSVTSWEHLGYDQPPEWDTSQESSQCADVADLGAFHDPLTNPLLDRSRDLQNRCAFSLIFLCLSPGGCCSGETEKRDKTRDDRLTRYMALQKTRCDQREFSLCRGHRQWDYQSSYHPIIH